MTHAELTLYWRQARHLGHDHRWYDHADETDTVAYCADCGAKGYPNGEGDLYSEGCNDPA